MEFSHVAVEDPGEGSPLFLVQTEVRGVKKKVTPAHSLLRLMDDCPPPPHSPYLKVWIRHCVVRFETRNTYAMVMTQVVLVLSPLD